MNPKRLEIWQRNYEYDRQEQADREDYIAWLNGTYVLAAIGAAFDGKKCPYPSEPYSVTQIRRDDEEAQRTADQIAAANFRAYAIALNKKLGFTTEDERA